MAFPPEALDVELDGLTDEPQRFIPCLTGCDTAGKIGDVGSERRGPLFDHNEVTHLEPLLSLEACLLQHAVECSWRNVDTRLARDSHDPRPFAGCRY